MMEFETFEVRQKLNTAIGGRMIVVHDGRNYREAEMFYDSVVKLYPNDYFEIYKIYKKETCIDWVNNKQKT